MYTYIYFGVLSSCHAANINYISNNYFNYNTFIVLTLDIPFFLNHILCAL